MCISWCKNVDNSTAVLPRKNSSHPNTVLFPHSVQPLPMIRLILLFQMTFSKKFPDGYSKFVVEFFQAWDLAEESDVPTVPLGRQTAH